MEEEKSIWQRLGIQDWFLTDEDTGISNLPRNLTPDDVYKYIIDKFTESIPQLSFAGRVVFYHEFIICFNPEDFKGFMNNKQGIFGLIVHECVKEFYKILKEFRAQGKTVEPSGAKWVFRFVSSPEYARGDIGFIGKLLPGGGGGNQKEENLRITFIPRQTGVAQTFDVNQDILKGFTFYSEGYYEVPYVDELEHDEKKIEKSSAFLARFDALLPEKEFSGKKVQYHMKEDEIIISGKDESREDANIFRIPSDWVSTPHLQVRFNKAEGKFYLASFGERTLLNEVEVEQSDVNSPKWVELPINSKMLLNGIIGVNIFKS
jgi:hypothetical protein